MSSNQSSVSANSTASTSSMFSTIGSNVDVDMSLDDHSGKNEIGEKSKTDLKTDSKLESKNNNESLGLDEDVNDELVTLYLVDRNGNPVFYTNKNDKNVKAEFQLTKKQLSISRLFFDSESGNVSTQLSSFDEAIPIPMSWATGSNPKQNPYTNDDAVYGLAKCVEWMKHYDGFNIAVIGEIPGTKFRTGLRTVMYGVENYSSDPQVLEQVKWKVFENACRGLDPRTRDHLAENIRRRLVRERLLTRIREMKGMSPTAVLDVKTENKLIYDMREDVEKESVYIRWVEKMLEETKEEEEKYFKENPPWFKTWIEEINSNATFTQLCSVMSCASYLDIKPLVNLVAAMIATIMKHKTAPKVQTEMQMRESRVSRI